MKGTHLHTSLIAATAFALTLLAGCSRRGEVPYTLMNNYFIHYGVQDVPPVITSEEEFGKYFSPAPVMGRGGEPTAVDFSREFVIAVTCPETDVATELSAVGLSRENGTLVFRYRLTTGEKMTYTMRPLLLVKVEGTDVKDVKVVRDR